MSFISCKTFKMIKKGENMDRLYYIEFSHIIILQEVEIGMETEDSLVTALGCSLNKIPKRFLTDEFILQWKYLYI